VTQPWKTGIKNAMTGSMARCLQPAARTPTWAPAQAYSLVCCTVAWCLPGPLPTSPQRRHSMWWAQGRSQPGLSPARRRRFACRACWHRQQTPTPQNPPSISTKQSTRVHKLPTTACPGWHSHVCATSLSQGHPRLGLIKSPPRPRPSLLQPHHLNSLRRDPPVPRHCSNALSLR